MEYPYSDITIINSSKEYRLNKIVLDNIPYFHNLFNSGFKESCENIINVEFNDEAWIWIVDKTYKAIKNSFQRLKPLEPGTKFNIRKTLEVAILCNFLGLDFLSNKCMDEVYGILMAFNFKNISVSELAEIMHLILNNNLYNLFYAIQYRIGKFSINELYDYPELYYLKYIQINNDCQLDESDQQIKEIQLDMDMLFIDYLLHENYVIPKNIEINSIKYIFTRMLIYMQDNLIQIDKNIINLHNYKDYMPEKLLQIFRTY